MEEESIFLSHIPIWSWECVLRKAVLGLSGIHSLVRSEVEAKVLKYDRSMGGKVPKNQRIWEWGGTKGLSKFTCVCIFSLTPEVRQHPHYVLSVLKRCGEENLQLVENY